MLAQADGWPLQCPEARTHVAVALRGVLSYQELKRLESINCRRGFLWERGWECKAPVRMLREDCLRAVLMHRKGGVLLLVRRLVSSGALEEPHLPVPWEPAAPRVCGDLSRVRLLHH